MEPTGGPVALLLCASVVLLSAVNSAPGEIRGTYGFPLTLPVRARFQARETGIGGSWSKVEPDHSHLASFENKTVIVNRLFERNVRLNLIDASLYIHRLEEAYEGNYKLELYVDHDNGTMQHVTEIVRVLVDVPVSTPVVEKSPPYAVLEDEESVTLVCSVARGNRVEYQWLKDNRPIVASTRHEFSSAQDILNISHVKKGDMGQYSCLVKNFVNENQSQPVNLTVFYGPYNLAVRTDQALQTGDVFMVNPGEQVFFDCMADSNPPNSCVWISVTSNDTEVVMTGQRFEVMSPQLAQAKEYVCRAFNNVTRKQDEAQFTLVVGYREKEKYTQEGGFMSPLAAVTLCSVLIIFGMTFVLWRRSCHPRRVIRTISKRPISEQRHPRRSGHEDASEDFGIYEFVAVPGRMEATQSSSRSLVCLDSTQDLHTTIYDVIRRIPETPTLSLLK
ncbi:HEPACAM family member 2 isoform X2 [Denticeps clupeoides]|uniref:Ig-like domain-containing protein n=1 Tax=Denticeps clupeoides TaxID=299321 RepID=A0AAY4EJ40_9TELE|nr:HEPACAM family member 2 isoform X2 [Denticeps clupeoides]